MNAGSDMSRVLGLALILWGGAVAGAAVDGVFAKLADEELAALALFAFAYAPAAYLLDRELRAFAHAASGFAGTLMVVDVALALTARAACATSDTWSALAGTPVFAVVVFFAVPLALTLHVAAIDRWLTAGPALSEQRGVS